MKVRAEEPSTMGEGGTSKPNGIGPYSRLTACRAVGSSPAVAILMVQSPSTRESTPVVKMAPCGNSSLVQCIDSCTSQTLGGQ